MSRVLRVLAVAAAALVMPTAALAGALTLHPSGFGEHSYSAWKAQEGLPDSKGTDSQALYFQKMTATATFAAGVSVIKGLEGLPADALTGLAWDHRTDGHCGAGAPRWNVNLTDGTNNYTLFLGCYAAAHSPVTGTDPGMHSWCKDTQPIQTAIGNLESSTGPLTIRNLAIVFDEGTDNPIPQPLGCPAGPSAPGFVYLDNITVELNGVPHVWTGASDNGNGQTIMMSTDPLETLLDAPLTSLFPS